MRLRGCDSKVELWTPGGREYNVKCGTFQGGRVVLCDPCEKQAEKDYPQGWLGYPGDTCEHGVYVGGCGEDRMCPACEGGD